ncbi:MAG: GNAT family N-acetyltransferase [Sulfolobales archaeon]
MAGESEYIIRIARKEDVEQISDLVLRLKKLNEEFDPLYTVRQEAPEVVRKYISDSLGREDVITLVAESSGRVVGVIRTEIRSRIFYEPLIAGVITDLYVLPSYRRKGVGEALISSLTKILKSRGVTLISAEFPPMNKIAVEFYTSLGFKPLLYVFFKEL